MKVKPTITDGSAIVTGLLLAFNIPSNLPIFIIVIGALVSIGVGKMSFGGLGNNPFNPDPRSPEVFVVQGEEKPALALTQQIRDHLGLSAEAPEIGQVVELF